jgi:hypothetical protein
MGIAYVVFVGLPLCFTSVITGLTLIALGSFICVTLVFLPVGVPMVAAGATSLAVGVRYVSLDRRFL